MSEFKFACPVCGQHITADSAATGTQIECPTCFQKIVVPQAPASADSKFAGTAGFIFRDKILKLVRQQTQPPPAADGTAGNITGSTTQQAVSPQPPARPIPTNIVWTLDLTNADFPEGVASGNVHGSGFLCERATLQGGNLTLRQTSSGSQDLGISVILFAQQGEELSGRTVVISADQTPPLPRVVLRWRDEAQQRKSRTFNSGYALNVQFGQASTGRMAGKLYVSFPDEAKSVVAGTFDAEIRKPAPPRPPRQPKPPALPKPSS